MSARRDLPALVPDNPAERSGWDQGDLFVARRSMAGHVVLVWSMRDLGEKADEYLVAVEVHSRELLEGSWEVGFWARAAASFDASRSDDGLAPREFSIPEAECLRIAKEAFL